MINCVIGVLIIVIFLLIRKALVPLAIGIALAYLICPLVDLLEYRFKIKRIFSILLSYFLLLAIIIAVLVGLASVIGVKIREPTLNDNFKILMEYYYKYQPSIEKLTGFHIESIRPMEIISKLGRSTLNFFIGTVASIYLLKDKVFFLEFLNKIGFLFLSQKIHGILSHLLFEINLVLRAFFKGIFIDSFIVAILSAVALSILKIDMAIFIGVFAGIANVIPYFGPIIGIIPAALSSLASGQISKAILSSVILVIIQQIECNFIYPKIIGNSTGLHPLFVLTSVTIAGYFGGFVWMILAVPIAGIINVLVKEWAVRQ